MNKDFTIHETSGQISLPAEVQVSPKEMRVNGRDISRVDIEEGTTLAKANEAVAGIFVPIIDDETESSSMISEAEEVAEFAEDFFADIPPPTRTAAYEAVDDLNTKALEESSEAEHEAVESEEESRKAKERAALGSAKAATGETEGTEAERTAASAQSKVEETRDALIAKETNLLMRAIIGFLRSIGIHVISGKEKEVGALFKTAFARAKIDLSKPTKIDRRVIARLAYDILHLGRDNGIFGKKDASGNFINLTAKDIDEALKKLTDSIVGHFKSRGWQVSDQDLQARNIEVVQLNAQGIEVQDRGQNRERVEDREILTIIIVAAQAKKVIDQLAILAKQIEKNKEEEQLQELDERRIRIIKKEVDRYELQHMIRIEENNKKAVLDIVAVAGKKGLIRRESGALVEELE